MITGERENRRKGEQENGRTGEQEKRNELNRKHNKVFVLFFVLLVAFVLLVPGRGPVTA